jgi:LysM repeat protein
MRHDAKLGLALGMLVIGFAVAFCFPRQPARIAPAATEQPSSFQDSALHFLPIRAYQSGTTPTREKETPASTPIIMASEVTPVTIAGREIDPTMLVPQPAPIDKTATQGTVPSPVAPIIVAVEPPSQFTANKPEQIKQELNTPAPAPAANASPKPHRPETYPETYEVKAGDTLSGIAAQFLGNANKYLELYEANRELLSSPNDLKIGMKLKIPPAVQSQPVRDNIPKDSRSWAGPPKPGRKILEEPRPERGIAPHESPIVNQPPKAPWLAERPEDRR